MEAMRIDALGYLLKGSGDGAFLHDMPVPVGCYGAAVVDPAIAADPQLRAPGTLGVHLPGPIAASVTAAERTVLTLMARDWTDRQIADHLHVTCSTVRGHVKDLRDQEPFTLRVQSLPHRCPLSASPQHTPYTPS